MDDFYACVAPMQGAVHGFLNLLTGGFPGFTGVDDIDLKKPEERLPADGGLTLRAFDVLARL